MNRSYTTAEKAHMLIIKAMPCIVCEQPGPSHAHHVRQDSAYHCIPLCYSCHQHPDTGIHGRKAMWKINRLDEIDAMAKLISWLSR